MKRKGFISGIVLCLLILTITGCPKREHKATIGQPASDFTLTDLDGKKVSLSEFRGKVVLLDFWATWCPPCRDSIPYLETLYREYKDNGLIVIGVSFDKDVEVVKRFKERYHITYLLLIGEEGVKNDYGITGVPETFIVSRDGILKSKHIGFSESLAIAMEEEIKGLL